MTWPQKGQWNYQLLHACSGSLWILPRLPGNVCCSFLFPHVTHMEWKWKRIVLEIPHFISLNYTKTVNPIDWFISFSFLLLSPHSFIYLSGWTVVHWHRLALLCPLAPQPWPHALVCVCRYSAALATFPLEESGWSVKPLATVFSPADAWQAAARGAAWAAAAAKCGAAVHAPAHGWAPRPHPCHHRTTALPKYAGSHRGSKGQWQLNAEK